MGSPSSEPPLLHEPLSAGHNIDDIMEDDLEYGAEATSDDDVDHTVSAARQGVWDGHYVADDSDCEDEEGCLGQAEDIEGSGDEAEDSGDEAEEEYGLSAVDILGEEFKRDAIANGKLLEVFHKPMHQTNIHLVVQRESSATPTCQFSEPMALKSKHT